MRVEFSPAAAADLGEIADYIARDSPSRARSFIDELEAQCVGLGDNPEMGAARPELAEGLRSLAYRRYILFYRIQESHVRIERVLHGMRDITTLLDA